MTIINPNSIAGITSVTAEADVMNFYKSNGTLGSLQLNGCNFNTTSGVSTFSNLKVGGTLTYEDVKNVDSVGIVTARQGVNVTGGGIHVTSGVVTATSFVGSGAALTGVASTEFVHAQTLAVVGISTISDLLNFPTNVTSTPSASGNVHIYRHDNILKMCGASGIRFDEGGHQRWMILNGALISHGTSYNNLGNTTNRIGNAYIQTSVDLIDNAELRIGSSDDFKIYHSGSDSYIVDSNAASDLFINSNKDLTLKIGDGAGGYHTALYADNDGAVRLYHNDVLKLETTSTGATLTGNLKLTAGSGTDTKIYTDNAAGIIYQADENGHKFQTWDSSAWQTALHIEDDGDIMVERNDIVVSGSGKGILLGGTAAANKLDAYEEGTWSPSFGRSSSAATTAYSRQYGKYTRVGNVVNIWFDVVLSSGSGGGGVWRIDGIPFTPLATGQSGEGGYGAPTFRSAAAMPVMFRTNGSSSWFSGDAGGSLYVMYYNDSGAESYVDGYAGTGGINNGRLTGAGQYYV